MLQQKIMFFKKTVGVSSVLLLLAQAFEVLWEFDIWKTDSMEWNTLRILSTEAIVSKALVGWASPEWKVMERCKVKLLL